MSAVAYTPTGQRSACECAVQRLYGEQAGNRAPYLLTVYPGNTLNWYGIDKSIQARAVVDDFGNLVAVGGWQ